MHQFSNSPHSGSFVDDDRAIDAVDRTQVLDISGGPSNRQVLEACGAAEAEVRDGASRRWVPARVSRLDEQLAPARQRSGQTAPDAVAVVAAGLPLQAHPQEVLARMAAA